MPVSIHHVQTSTARVKTARRSRKPGGLVRIEYEPDREVALKTTPQSSPELEMRFTLHDEGGGTRIVDEWKLDLGKPAFVQRLAAAKVKSAVAENLDRLKQLLEEGQVVLQDGKQATL